VRVEDVAQVERARAGRERRDPPGEQQHDRRDGGRPRGKAAPVARRRVAQRRPRAAIGTRSSLVCMVGVASRRSIRAARGLEYAPMISALVRSLRPAQWSKNVFVFAPLVFARLFLDPRALTRAAMAFAAFCAAASAIYLINDVRDREEDRRHPLKSRRPIAAGELGVGTALVAAAALVAASLVLAWALGTAFAGLLAVYLIINLLYSAGLKHVVILDVMAIASGFVLRVLAGAAAVGAAVSHWLILCTTFLSLLLAFSKRRHELLLLQSGAAEQRRVLEEYSPAFLDQMMNVVTASAVVSYALYAVAPETVQKFHSELLVWTIPLVLFGVFRYLYLTYQRTEVRNPTEAILVDAPFLVNLGLWGLVVLWIVGSGS
jgi:4-hydroxybenzoate polyprenyltransferase